MTPKPHLIESLCLADHIFSFLFSAPAKFQVTGLKLTKQPFFLSSIYLAPVLSRSPQNFAYLPAYLPAYLYIKYETAVGTTYLIWKQGLPSACSLARRMQATWNICMNYFWAGFAVSASPLKAKNNGIRQSFKVEELVLYANSC